MIKINRYENLGYHDFGWLKARYHFSFGRYVNRERMGFGTLRVINDDIVQAGDGFGTHPNDNMEIITYVRKGAISHRDSIGNEGHANAGNVQVMSAGRGIEHSEFNEGTEETHLFQIWITPREHNIEPRWDMRDFAKTAVNDHLPLLVSGFEEDKNIALYINQDARIYGGKIASGVSIAHPITNQAYLLVSEGEIEIDRKILKRGDSAEITNTDSITFSTLTESDILIIDVPSK